MGHHNGVVVVAGSGRTRATWSARGAKELAVVDTELYLVSRLRKDRARAVRGAQLLSLALSLLRTISAQLS